MNDPGLDSTVQENATHLDESDAYGKEAEEEAEVNASAPNRWWFSPTGIPLIAGTFGPIANAFSICALVEPWRSLLTDGTEETAIRIPDPKWLIAINALSLTIALIANLALLLNMGRRLAFSIAQPITIIGWYIASFLLIALVIAAPVRLHNGTPENDAFTQAFYYAIFAAVLYFIVASLMAVSVFGAYRGHYSPEFKLTTSQRTLMLQTILFLGYILLGGLVYSHVENWKYLDAVYFADVTLLTVGLGDFTPFSALGRALLFPFAIGGIVFVGLVIGSIRSLLLERVKEKMSFRMVEKTRQDALKSLNSKKGTIKVSLFSRRSIHNGSSSTKDRTRAEFEVMRLIQEQAEWKRRWTSLAVAAGAFLALWLVGAAVFQKSESPQNWTYYESVYFAYTSLLTIGYGDFRPQGNSGKAFFVVWSLLAVPTLTILVSNIGSTIASTIRDVTLRVGEWTVLPGDTSLLQVLRQRKMTHKRKHSGPEEGAAEYPAGISGQKQQNGMSHAGMNLDQVNGVGKKLESTEEHKGNEAERIGDYDAEYKHRRQRALMDEIRKVMLDLNQTPSPQYSHERWTRFLDLIGQEVVPWTEMEKHRDEKTSKQSDAEDKKRTRRPWSWLSTESALMSTKTEPEWVLTHLALALEDHLEKPTHDRNVHKEDGHRMNT